MSSSPEILYKEHLLVGESPCWDKNNNVLYFTDIRGNCFYKMDGLGGNARKYNVPQMLGCLALCRNNDLLLSMENGIYRMNTNCAISPAHIPVKLKGERFNDGKVGPDGHYYVGTADANGKGAFYRLSDGKLTELFDGCACSNGLDWSKDNKTLYYIDSPTQKIEMFDFSSDTHSVSNRRTLFSIPPALGCGDGMALDEENNLWVAVWGGSCILHIDGKRGRLIEKITVPAKQVSSVCFAGENMDELVITTASVRTNLKEDPLAGYVFVYHSSVRGNTAKKYKY